MYRSNIGQCYRTHKTVTFFLLVILIYSLYSSDSFYSWWTVSSTNDEEIYRNITSASCKPVVFWGNDFHISPIKDLKHLLSPMGVYFFDRSLSGHCRITRTCSSRRNLKVLTRANAMDLDHSLIPKFYEAYRNDKFMKQVDAFVCFHPTSMCELFEPFNKSLIIIASTRYELGRFDPKRWVIWNDNLLRYAADPKNIIGANNLYDAEYIKYFTGIQPELLTSFCDYVTDKYNPTRAGFLLAPIHHKNFTDLFKNEYKKACNEQKCGASLTEIRKLYRHYKYSDLASHRGIVYVPYQVSVMSLFEQYRMNIPLFFPSIHLLTHWQITHMVMNERTWDGVDHKRPAGSNIPPHPSQKDRPDPNNEQDAEAIRYWIKYSDFYQFPHIMYYDSVPDLVNKLETITMEELRNVSRAMQQFNVDEKTKLLAKWKAVLDRIVKCRSDRIIS